MLRNVNGGKHFISRYFKKVFIVSGVKGRVGLVSVLVILCRNEKCDGLGVRCTLPHVHVCMFTCAYVCLLLSAAVEGVEVGVVGGRASPSISP